MAGGLKRLVAGAGVAVTALTMGSAGADQRPAPQIKPSYSVYGPGDSDDVGRREVARVTVSERVRRPANRTLDRAWEFASGNHNLTLLRG